MDEKNKGMQAFVNTIEVIADNKYVLGEQLVDIGIGGPTLEATLAAIAMAQGELGHARLLYNWSFDLRGVKKSDIEKQTGKAFHSVVQTSDWIGLIGAMYIVNLGFEIVLKEMLDARHADVVNRIHKLLKEQKEHILYSRGWVLQLLQDEGAVPVIIKEALEKTIPEVTTWLQQLEQSTDLSLAGYISTKARLVEKFQEAIVLEPKMVDKDAV